MLAKISEGVPDAIKQLKGAPFLAEYKYDGTRAQIHLLPDNSVKIFSRNCEDKTVSMPDVVAAIQAAAQGLSLLDMHTTSASSYALPTSRLVYPCVPTTIRHACHFSLDLIKLCSGICFYHCLCYIP